MRRPFELTVALATTALLLLGGAAVASAHNHTGAHRHTGIQGSCRVTLTAEPHTVTSGEPVEVFGQLLCTGGTTEGQTVTIYGRPVTAPGPLRLLAKAPTPVIGTPTTGPSGFFSFVQADVSGDTLYYASARGARSPARSVRVAPQVTLKGPSEVLPLYTGFRSRVTFTGTVSPEDEGARVVLQRENAISEEAWHEIGISQVGAGGIYAITHTFHYPGDANLRVLVRKHGRLTVRGVSNTVSYGISQRENPNLTLSSSAYSVRYGSPVTLSGVVRGGAGHTVTLLARGRGSGEQLSAIATMTAGSGGEYQFVQTPLQSTVYKVTSGGVNSALLFGGVKYILTAGVSASTVQAGQPLTFAGTVSPTEVGKDVYLEREDSSGSGFFHVADVTTVGPGGTYSLTDFVFGQGKTVFRVLVHGDSSHQEAVSQLFATEVTAPPAASLRPQAQPKQPKEGQI